LVWIIIERQVRHKYLGIRHLGLKALQAQVKRIGGRVDSRKPIIRGRVFFLPNVTFIEEILNASEKEKKSTGQPTPVSSCPTVTLSS
jgi:hypothetical protein